MANTEIIGLGYRSCGWLLKIVDQAMNIIHTPSTFRNSVWDSACT
ncbi:hypothetical protein ETAA8_31610 [Anatilimnocola aggregata]|uniref:Uncharacterized protein n=1 Tax=Anatilimnocola aggregata TaxID=2528021 RepID=A0A517YD13_9BACT|nr:hypothetical protein ETAA8_31610 [Anatilimnocola aggregata]